MIAEILCVGTELLLGDTINTNASYIARELAKIGIEVYHHSVVGDNPARLKESLNLCLSRSDMVLLTGGLGPTYDDLTKETVAEYFGKKMVEDKVSMERLKEAFKGREMTENNLKQAMMPEGAIALQNDFGTAPGLIVEGNGKIVALMPGPPREMEPMMHEGVIPYLLKKTQKVLVSHTLHLYGIGESSAEMILKEKMINYTNPTIAPYAKEGELQLRITASAKTQQEAEQLIGPVVEEVKEAVGQYVYGIDIGTLQNALVEKLKEKKLTIATAESCTGGLVSKRITEIPGASAVFGCGVCAYANEIKKKVLGVSHETLEKYGAVSEQTALEMAKGVRRLSGADIGISTTGIAGPDGGTDKKPVGLVYVGVDSEWFSGAIEVPMYRNRRMEREHVRYLASSRAIYEALKVADQK